nr:hypothetical protein [uncultured Cupriavidus sp.]
MQSPYQDTAAVLPPAAAATPDVYRKVGWRRFPDSNLTHGSMREAIAHEVACVPVRIL